MRLSVLILGALVAGCASNRPPSERIAPGSVAIVAAHYAPAAEFNAFASGRGANALRKAREHAGKGAYAGGFVPALFTQAFAATPLAVLGLIATAAGATVGGVIGGAVGVLEGTLTAMPSDQRDAIHRPIKRARLDGELQTAISAQVLELGAHLPHHRLSYLPQFGPTSPGEAPDYGMLKAMGFDSVLELAVTSIGFKAEEHESPNVTFEMTVRARAIPLAEGAKPWVREETYGGRPRPVAEWQAKGERLLQEDLDASLGVLASLVQTTMFGGQPPVPPADKVAPPVSTVTASAPIAPASLANGPLPVAGDSWTYNVIDARGRHRQSQRVAVASVASGTIEEQPEGRGRPAPVRHAKGRYLVEQGDVWLFSPYLAAFDPAIQTEQAATLDVPACHARWMCTITARVVGKETVRVPAGEFDAIKMEVQHTWTARSSAADSGARTLTIWYSPLTKRALKFSSRGSNSGFFESNFDVELASYQLH